MKICSLRNKHLPSFPSPPPLLRAILTLTKIPGGRFSALVDWSLKESFRHLIQIKQLYKRGCVFRVFYLWNCSRQIPNPPAARLFSGRLTVSSGRTKNARYVTWSIHLFSGSTSERFTSMFHEGEHRGSQGNKTHCLPWGWLLCG